MRLVRVPLMYRRFVQYESIAVTHVLLFDAAWLLTWLRIQFGWKFQISMGLYLVEIRIDRDGIEWSSNVKAKAQ